MKDQYINIVIAGDIASGKTTLAKMLADYLNWEFRSAGDFFRSYMKEHNLDLSNKLLIPDEVDKAFDADFLNMIKTTPNVIFEGHYQGWNARNVSSAYKILVESNLEMQLERATQRTDQRETIESFSLRHETLKVAFEKRYGTDDYLDKRYFNCILKNITNTKEEMLENAVEILKKETNFIR